MSIHVVTDAELRPNFALAVLRQHKLAESPPRKMSAVLNKWLRQNESEERRQEAEGRASVETPRNSPLTSINHGSEGRRRDRSADYSDASLRTDDLAGETKKKDQTEREMREEKEAEKTEKAEKEKQRDKPAAESLTPESAKSRWGGLFGRPFRQVRQIAGQTCGGGGGSTRFECTRQDYRD